MRDHHSPVSKSQPSYAVTSWCSEVSSINHECRHQRTEVRNLYGLPSDSNRRRPGQSRYPRRRIVLRLYQWASCREQWSSYKCCCCWHERCIATALDRCQTIQRSCQVFNDSVIQSRRNNTPFLFLTLTRYTSLHVYQSIVVIKHNSNSNQDDKQPTTPLSTFF